MRVVGLFDKDAAARAPHGAEPRQSSAVVTTNPVGQLKPENLQNLNRFVDAFGVQTAVLATEPADAQSAADAAVAAGVRSILNYSSGTPLDVPEGVEVIDAWGARLPGSLVEAPTEPRPAAGGSHEAGRWSRYDRDFETLRLLGHGNYGVVYESRNRLDGRRYAVTKIVLRHLSATETADDARSDQQLVASFVRDSDAYAWRWMLREVRAMATIRDNDNVVRYHQSWLELSDSVDQLSSDSGSSGSGERSEGGDGPALILCIQMQLCEGQTLGEALRARDRKGEPLPLQLVVGVLGQMLAGVEHIHEEGFLHRDLKPGNVFLTRPTATGSNEGDDGSLTVLIGDLGLAAELPSDRPARRSEAVTEAGGARETDEKSLSTGVGTWSYAAPEQRAKGGGDAAVEARSDVFSCGVVLFEMLHPGFATQMQRAMALAELRDRRQLPDEMLALCAPEPATVGGVGGAVRKLRRCLGELALEMTAPQPADRPTVAEARRRLGLLAAEFERGTAAAEPEPELHQPEPEPEPVAVEGQGGHVARLEAALARERFLREIEVAALRRQLQSHCFTT